jgi:hypothetical protein
MKLLDRKIPSEAGNLLNKLKSENIVSMIRLLNYNPKEEKGRFKLQYMDCFELGYGPLYIGLESNETIGIANISKWNSLVIWQESEFLSQDSIIYKNNEQDDQLYISCDDEVYSTKKWAKFIGKKIKTITLIKNKVQTRIQMRDEVGLILGINDGEDLLLSKSLCVGLFGHFILTGTEVLSPEINKGVDYIEL